MPFLISAEQCRAVVRPRRFNTIFGRIGEWMRHRRDTRLLEGLNDEQLKDIGLSRSEIGVAVRSNSRNPAAR